MTSVLFTSMQQVWMLQCIIGSISMKVPNVFNDNSQLTLLSRTVVKYCVLLGLVHANGDGYSLFVCTRDLHS